MTKIFQYIVIATLLFAIGFILHSQLSNVVPAEEEPKLSIDSDFVLNDLEDIVAPKPAPEGSVPTSSIPELDTPLATEATSSVEIVAENLTIPWDLVFVDGGILIAERSGDIIAFDIGSSTHTTIEVEDVLHSGEGGLLGMVAHPQFEDNRYIYLYRTSTSAGKSINTVLRYVFEDNSLSDETVILGNIPGALFHNGGRMAFGPDGFLYIATGDAQIPELAQDTESLAGKILRVTDDGRIPEDNPFGNEVYSYGHRNPQGLTWDSDGALWSTEHGRSGVRSGLDELNLIIKGENYGWPESQGELILAGTIGPVIHSGENTTWAPASAAYTNGRVFFGGLRGETLYETVISGVSVETLKEHFVGVYGRIRTVVIGPDGMLYMLTSNRDGRGSIQKGDDKVLRVDPESL